MKQASWLVAGALATAVGLLAQGPGPGDFRPHGPGPMSFMGMQLGKVIAGAPYSADIATTVVQTLSDGNTIRRVTKGHVARDEQGRTYLQQNISGGPWAQKGPTTITFLSDPVAGYSYVLNPKTKKALRREFHARTGERSYQQRGENGSRNGSTREEADLGQQMMSGVSATGKSITHTIPAGAVGNAQPIVDKTEIWISPDLQIVVFSKRHDPRFGESTYELSNIQKAEPNAALFQVPSDETVEDAPRPEFRR